MTTNTDRHEAATIAAMHTEQWGCNVAQLDDDDDPMTWEAAPSTLAAELDQLRRLRVQVDAAYAAYLAEWGGYTHMRPFTLDEWLAWLASDGSTPPVAEVQP